MTDQPEPTQPTELCNRKRPAESEQENDKPRKRITRGMAVVYTEPDSNSNSESNLEVHIPEASGRDPDPEQTYIPEHELNAPSAHKNEKMERKKPRRQTIATVRMQLEQVTRERDELQDQLRKLRAVDRRMVQMDKSLLKDDPQIRGDLETLFTKCHDWAMDHTDSRRLDSFLTSEATRHIMQMTRSSDRSCPYHFSSSECDEILPKIEGGGCLLIEAFLCQCIATKILSHSLIILAAVRDDQYDISLGRMFKLAQQNIRISSPDDARLLEAHFLRAYYSSVAHGNDKACAARPLDESYEQFFSRLPNLRRHFTLWFENHIHGFLKMLLRSSSPETEQEQMNEFLEICFDAFKLSVTMWVQDIHVELWGRQQDHLLVGFSKGPKHIEPHSSMFFGLDDRSREHSSCDLVVRPAIIARTIGDLDEQERIWCKAIGFAVPRVDIEQAEASSVQSDRNLPVPTANTEADETDPVRERHENHPPLLEGLVECAQNAASPASHLLPPPDMNIDRIETVPAMLPNAMKDPYMTNIISEADAAVQKGNHQKSSCSSPPKIEATIQKQLGSKHPIHYQQTGATQGDVDEPYLISDDEATNSAKRIQQVGYKEDQLGANDNRYEQCISERDKIVTAQQLSSPAQSMTAVSSSGRTDTSFNKMPDSEPIRTEHQQEGEESQAEVEEHSQALFPGGGCAEHRSAASALIQLSSSSPHAAQCERGQEQHPSEREYPALVFVNFQSGPLGFVVTSTQYGPHGTSYEVQTESEQEATRPTTQRLITQYPH